MLRHFLVIQNTLQTETFREPTENRGDSRMQYSKAGRLVTLGITNDYVSLLGPKTVFFWGAVSKGGLVAAGLGDLTRPADTLSSRQSLSLALTGCIWARWCLVIIPKNYPLFVVNSFVGLTNFYQFVRAIRYKA